MAGRMSAKVNFKVDLTYFDFNKLASLFIHTRTNTDRSEIPMWLYVV